MQFNGGRYPPTQPKPHQFAPKFGQHSNRHHVSHPPANFEDEDSFDESDEDDVYFNEDPNNMSPAPMRARQGNMNFPPRLPPAQPSNAFNPKPAVPKKPSSLPINDSQASGDDMYLPIVDSAQGNNRRFESHSAYNPPNPVPTGRPSYPPPSPNRPPIPTPANHDASRQSLEKRSSRSDRMDPSPRSSLTNRSSPVSSPGVPSRGSSDRSSGPRLPHRDGSRSSQDSSGSNPSDRSDHARHSAPPPVEQRHGSFQKSKNASLPGFGNSAFPLHSKPDTSSMPPMRPVKPDHGADRLPTPGPKPFATPPSMPPAPSNSFSPWKRAQPSSTELNNQFNNLLRTSSDHPRSIPTASVVEKQVWFKQVDRSQATAMINQNQQEGCFIVRPGKTSSLPYSLTLYASGTIFNLQVRLRSDRKYALGSEKANEMAFSSVVELIDYHKSTAVVLASDKGSVLLTEPPP